MCELNIQAVRDVKAYQSTGKQL